MQESSGENRLKLPEVHKACLISPASRLECCLLEEHFRDLVPWFQLGADHQGSFYLESSKTLDSEESKAFSISHIVQMIWPHLSIIVMEPSPNPYSRCYSKCQPAVQFFLNISGLFLIPVLIIFQYETLTVLKSKNK